MTFVATDKVAALRPPTSVGVAFQGAPSHCDPAAIAPGFSGRHDEPSRSRAQTGIECIIVIGS